MSGTDARRGFERVGNEMVDRYATDIFTEEANNVIESCKHQINPMFLMVSHLAVHTGVPGPNILEVSNTTNNDIRFNYIENKERRLYAGKKYLSCCTNTYLNLNYNSILNFANRVILR